MKEYLIIVIGFSCLLSSFSCSKKRSTDQNNHIKRIELTPKYKQIENLISIADCQGPDGNYITEVHSTKNGYTYFSQKYEYKDDEFEVILENEDFGYSVDLASGQKDTLSQPVLEVIKGHEFHKISLFPDMFFSNIMYQKDSIFRSQSCEVFSATDHSRNPVRIFYDRNEMLIIGFNFYNPFDPSEKIETHFQKWEASDYGKLVKELEIVQAERDTFNFIFNRILINSEKFDRKSYH